jgi:hypothetical protein
VLGKDEDGDEITSAVPEYIPNPPPKARAGGHGPALKPRQKLVLEVITDEISQGESVSLGRVKDVAVESMARGESKEDNRRRDVERAVEALQALGYVTLRNGMVTLQ